MEKFIRIIGALTMIGMFAWAILWNNSNFELTIPCIILGMADICGVGLCAMYVFDKN